MLEKLSVNYIFYNLYFLTKYRFTGWANSIHLFFWRSLTRWKFFLNDALPFFRPFPCAQRHLFFAIGISAITVLLFSGFQQKKQMDETENAFFQCIQTKYNHVLGRITTHFNVMSRLIEKENRHNRLPIMTERVSGFKDLSFEMRIGDSARDTLEEHALVLRKTISGSDKTLVCRIPYRVLSKLVGVTHLSHKQRYSGKLQTKAGTLYYPYIRSSFVSLFIKETLLNTLLILTVVLVGFLFFLLVWSAFLVHARTRVKNEIIHYRSKSKRLRSENRSLFKEANDLKEYFSLKEHAENALNHMKTVHEERQEQYMARANSFLTLLKNAVRREGCSFQTIGFAAQLDSALRLQSSHLFELQGLASVDVPHVIERVFNILSPVMARNCLTLKKELPTENTTLEFSTYFCDTYASWQKGGIENMNGRLRRDLPRSTNLKNMKDQDLEQITLNHNMTPRKCLGRLSPIEALAKHMNKNIIFLFKRGVALQL